VPLRKVSYGIVPCLREKCRAIGIGAIGENVLRDSDIRETVIGEES
jgi:hypothetical protein